MADERDEGSLPRFEGYRTLRLIEHGGMGTVYEGERISDGRRVALKVPHEDTVVRGPELRRFLREGRRTSELEHPNIVGAIEYRDGPDGCLLVVDYIDGVPITDWPDAANGPPPRDLLDRKLEILADVADALHYLHGEHTVHRDVKPTNILVRPDGHPYLIDFGFARNVIEDSALTGTDQVFGTLLYMPPEQVRGPMDCVGPPADIYGLGATAFHVVAGRPPFLGNQVELMLKIQTHEPPSLTMMSPCATPRLRAVLERALEKEPGERYASMKDFADDLRGVVAGTRTIATPATAALRRTRRNLRRRRAAIVAGVAIVLAVLGFLIAGWESDERAVAEELTRGRGALEAGDLDAALAAFTRASAIDPGGFEPSLARGSAYAEYEMAELAAASVEEAIARGYDVSPPVPAARDHYFQALLILRDGRLPDVVELLWTAVEQDPELFEAYLPLYYALDRLRQTARANGALTRYRSNLKPRNPRFEFVGALIQRGNGQYVASLSSLEDIRATLGDDVPDWLPRHIGIGALHILLQQERGALDPAMFDRAVAAFEEALERIPSDASSGANLAICRYLDGDIDGARGEAMRALALDPLQESARRLMAVILGRSDDAHDLSSAESHLEALPPWAREGSEVRRLQSQLAYRRGLLCRQDDRPDEAHAAFEEALRHAPEHAGALALLGFEAWIAADHAGALDLLERSLAAIESWAPRPRLDPWDDVFGDRELLANVHISVFDSAARLGRPQRALTSLEFLRTSPAVIDRTLSENGALNLAEALATCPLPEGRDCPWAKRIVEDFGLREHFEGSEDGEPLLDKIDAACP